MSLNMMNFLLFVTASFLLIITPGPNTIYIITRGISQGRSAAIFSALGAAAGDLVHVTAAICGLAILLQTSTIAYIGLKILGAVYLLYLGIRSIFTKKDLLEIKVPENQSKSQKQLFFQGLLTAILNPKTALFFVSFLPQFIDHNHGSAVFQTSVFGLTFAVMGTIMMLAMAAASGQVRAWLLTRKEFGRYIQLFSGSVFIGLGVKLALPDHR